MSEGGRGEAERPPTAACRPGVSSCNIDQAGCQLSEGGAAAAALRVPLCSGARKSVGATEREREGGRELVCARYDTIEGEKPRASVKKFPGRAAAGAAAVSGSPGGTCSLLRGLGEADRSGEREIGSLDLSLASARTDTPD